MTDPEKAEAEKQRGNRAFKKKDFDTAISHYEEALHLNPLDLEPPYRIAKAKFEQKIYHDCIYFCETAVKVGN